MKILGSSQLSCRVQFPVSCFYAFHSSMVERYLMGIVLQVRVLLDGVRSCRSVLSLFKSGSQPALLVFCISQPSSEGFFMSKNNLIFLSFSLDKVSKKDYIINEAVKWFQAD